MAPFDCFPACDGWVVVGIGNDRLWRMFAALIDPALAQEDRYATNSLRIAHYDDLRRHEVLAILHAARIPAGRMRHIDELAQDENLAARDMLITLPFEDGSHVLVPGSPLHLRGMDRPTYRRAGITTTKTGQPIGCPAIMITSVRSYQPPNPA